LKQAVEEAWKEGLQLDYIVSDVSKEEDCSEAPKKSPMPFYFCAMTMWSS
jgi:hypothetical protein